MFSVTLKKIEYAKGVIRTRNTDNTMANIKRTKQTINGGQNTAQKTTDCATRISHAIVYESADKTLILTYIWVKVTNLKR